MVADYNEKIPLKDDSGKDLGKITSDGSDREKQL
jgi:hypothetical protein